MNGLLRDVAGGLVKGAGDALVAQAQAKQAKALEQLRGQNTLRQIRAQNEGALARLRVGGRQERQTLGIQQDFQARQADLDRSTKRGLLQDRQSFEARQAAAGRDAQARQVSDTFQNADGEIVGVTAGGETKVLGQGQRPSPEIQRVVSGDDPVGQRAGLQPGERGRVTLAGGRITSVERDDLDRRGNESEFDRRVRFLRTAGFSDQEIANIESGRRLPDVADIELRVRDQVIQEVENGILPFDSDVDQIVRDRTQSVIGAAQGSFGGAPRQRTATRPASAPASDGTGQARAAAPASVSRGQGQGGGRTALTPRSQGAEGQQASGNPGAPRAIPRPQLDLFPGGREAEALGLPAGSQPVGRTQGGDVVYETPSGERFVLEGAR